MWFSEKQWKAANLKSFQTKIARLIETWTYKKRRLKVVFRLVSKKKLRKTRQLRLLKLKKHQERSGRCSSIVLKWSHRAPVHQLPTLPNLKDDTGVKPVITWVKLAVHAMKDNGGEPCTTKYLETNAKKVKTTEESSKWKHKEYD